MLLQLRFCCHNNARKFLNAATWFCPVRKPVGCSTRMPSNGKKYIQQCTSFHILSTGVNNVPLSSVDTRHFMTGFVCNNKHDDQGQGNISNDEFVELRERYKDDPQVKEWLSELTADFSDSRDQKVADPVADNDHIDIEQHNELASENSNEEEASEQKIDIDKEMSRYNIEEFYGVDEEDDEDSTDILPEEVTHPISFMRGKTGVFDVEEIVKVLQNENGTDICVIKVPEEYDYVDYMIIVNGRSLRHLKAMASYMKWLYKKKRGTNDAASCRIEGLNSNDWLAIDLKNAVVHFMLPATREEYDLETLWTVGADYDDKMKEEEDTFEIMFMEDIQTAASSVKENVLTLSEKAEYIYDKEEITNVEYKFSKSNKKQNMDMENVAGWHSYEEQSGGKSGV